MKNNWWSSILMVFGASIRFIIIGQGVLYLSLLLSDSKETQIPILLLVAIAYAFGALVETIGSVTFNKKPKE